MVITKKIEKAEKELEKERQAIIEKGGKVSMDATNSIDSGRKSVVLRVPNELLTSIDKHLKGKYGMNRTNWILQAIQEKLGKENGMDQR